MKVAVSFTVTYTLEVSEEELAKYGSDDALKEWVFDNALPDVRYPDYSGNNSYICIPAFKRVGWDWSGEYDDFEVKLEEEDSEEESE